MQMVAGGQQHLNKDEQHKQQTEESKGKEEKPPCPPIPPEKCDTWLANLKSQLRLIMTGKGLILSFDIFY